jgi:hypothetical protein
MNNRTIAHMSKEIVDFVESKFTEMQASEKLAALRTAAATVENTIHTEAMLQSMQIAFDKLGK